MDNDDQKQASGPTTSPVMDIQPPKPVDDPTPPPAVPPEETPVPPTEAPEVHDDPLASNEASITDAPADTVAPSVEGPVHPKDPNPLAIPELPAPKKGGAPKAAVVVAILIAMALAAVAVFAYLKTKKDQPATETNQQAQTTPVTADEVDQATKDVEDSINSVNDDSDFPETELSDQNLGL